MKNRSCQKCDTAFYCSPSRLNNGYGLYCSHACYHSMRPGKPVKRPCLECGQAFDARDRENRNPRFCSRSCYSVGSAKARLGECVRIDNRTNCHIWLGSKSRDGYGVFTFRKERRAHRAAWVIKNGPIPKGLFVLHHCDVPLCVNPKHLWIGTQQDNMNDMMRKGRENPCRGRENAGAKLTHAAVRAIRKSGAPHKDLAEKYKVSTSTISRVQLGNGWVHVR